MKQYRLILFDWDGTIAKTLDIWSEALKHVLNERGVKFSENDVGANYESFRANFQLPADNTFDEIIEDALTISALNIPSVVLYTNATKVISKLYKTKKLGIVTTSMHKDIDPLILKHGLQKYFSAVICGDDVNNQKPDSEPLLKAIGALNVSKTETLMVGDSDKDIIAAKNAGIDSMLFYPSEHENYHDIQYLKSLQPTYIINGLSDIFKTINIA